jgi:hypothetical protein
VGELGGGRLRPPAGLPPATLSGSPSWNGKNRELRRANDILNEHVDEAGDVVGVEQRLGVLEAMVDEPAQGHAAGARLGDQLADLGAGDGRVNVAQDDQGQIGQRGVVQLPHRAGQLAGGLARLQSAPPRLDLAPQDGEKSSRSVPASSSVAIAVEKRPAVGSW